MGHGRADQIRTTLILRLSSSQCHLEGFIQVQCPWLLALTTVVSNLIQTAKKMKTIALHAVILTVLSCPLWYFTCNCKLWWSHWFSSEYCTGTAVSEAERLSSLYLGRDYSISSLEIFIALLTSSNTHEPLKISVRRDILRSCSRYLGKSKCNIKKVSRLEIPHSWVIIFLFIQPNVSHLVNSASVEWKK